MKPAREITTHKVNGLNEVLRIEVLDEPGAGGASHVYGITSDEPRNAENPPAVTLPVRFQNGPIAVAGVNGISNEALLAIVIDRLDGFQNGPFANRENALAASPHPRASCPRRRRHTAKVKQCFTPSPALI